ncbi:MAG: hypothetical protein WC683_05705 [bacterium]
MGGILTPGVTPAMATGFSIGAVPNPLTAVTAPAIGHGNGGDSFVNVPTDSGVRIHQLIRTVSGPDVFWSREPHRAVNALKAFSRQGSLSEADLVLLAYNYENTAFLNIAVANERTPSMALIRIAEGPNIIFSSGIESRAVQILEERARKGQFTQVDLMLAARATDSKALMMIAADNPLTDRASLFNLAFRPGILGKGTFSSVAKVAARTLASLAEQGLLSADEILFAREVHENPVVRDAAIEYGERGLGTKEGQIIADLTMKAWSDDLNARSAAAQDARTPTPVLMDLVREFEHDDIRRDALNALRARSKAGGLSEVELAYIAVHFREWHDLQSVVIASDRSPGFALLRLAWNDSGMSRAAVEALRSRQERGLLTETDLALATIHENPKVRDIAARDTRTSVDRLLELSRHSDYYNPYLNEEELHPDALTAESRLEALARSGRLTGDDLSSAASHPSKRVRGLAASK